MSTRGTFIVRKDGKDARELYIASDAYPEWSGNEVVELIKYCEKNLTGCNVLYSMLFQGGDGDFDKNEIISRLKDGKPFLYGSCDRFIRDSLFCEYAYVVDLDDYTLKFYIGYQEKPDQGSVYGQKPNSSGYYPCKHICTFNIRDIAGSDSNEWIIDRMIEEEKENALVQASSNTGKKEEKEDGKNIIVRLNAGHLYVSADHGEWQVYDFDALPDGIKTIMKALCDQNENTVIDAKEENNG